MQTDAAHLGQRQPLLAIGAPRDHHCVLALTGERESQQTTSQLQQDTVEQVRAEAGKSRRWGEQHKVNQKP